MEIVDIFSENGKTLNEILEEYILVTLQSLIYDEKLII
jgi:hypothetical protein